MNYSVDDLTERYFKRIAEELKEQYRLLVQKKVVQFQPDISPAVKSVQNLDPSTGEYREYSYPLEYDLKLLYDFAVGNVGVEVDVEVALENVLRTVWWSPFQYAGEDTEDYTILWNKWKEKTRLGFLCYFVKSKLRLYEGKDLQALELAVISGFSNSMVCNRLRSNELSGRRVGNMWEVPNKEARKYVLEHQPGRYKDLAVK